MKQRNQEEEREGKEKKVFHLKKKKNREDFSLTSQLDQNHANKEENVHTKTHKSMIKEAFSFFSLCSESLRIYKKNKQMQGNLS